MISQEPQRQPHPGRPGHAGRRGAAALLAAGRAGRRACTAARPVVPVRLLGEDLVLFRDERGRARADRPPLPAPRAPICATAGSKTTGCAARSTAGISTATGQCVEQPGEPEGLADARDRSAPRPIRWSRRNGIVFAYMGPGEPPAFPDFDCFRAPDTHVFAFKGLWECNWLQALEVGIDPAHASFLHRFLRGRGPRRQLRQAVPRQGRRTPRSR